MPQPALPGLMDEGRIRSADQSASSPSVEPVAAKGQIAIEAARDPAGEQEALAIIQSLDAGCERFAVGDAVHLVERIENHPSGALGFEGRTRGQATDHSLERLPDIATA